MSINNEHEVQNTVLDIDNNTLAASYYSKINNNQTLPSEAIIKILNQQIFSKNKILISISENTNDIFTFYSNSKNTSPDIFSKDFIKFKTIPEKIFNSISKDIEIISNYIEYYYGSDISFEIFIRDTNLYVDVTLYSKCSYSMRYYHRLTISTHDIFNYLYRNNLIELEDFNITDYYKYLRNFEKEASIVKVLRENFNNDDLSISVNELEFKFEAVIRFRNIEISNENGDKYTIDELFVVLTFDLDFGKFYEISGVKAKYNQFDLLNNNIFTHPHLKQVFKLSKFCLGNTVIKIMNNLDLNNPYFTEEQFLTFIYLLKKYIKTESLEGGAYCTFAYACSYNDLNNSVIYYEAYEEFLNSDKFDIVNSKLNFNNFDKYNFKKSVTSKEKLITEKEAKQEYARLCYGWINDFALWFKDAKILNEIYYKDYSALDGLVTINGNELIYNDFLSSNMNILNNLLLTDSTIQENLKNETDIIKKSRVIDYNPQS